MSENVRLVINLPEWVLVAAAVIGFGNLLLNLRDSLGEARLNRARRKVMKEKLKERGRG